MSTRPADYLNWETPAGRLLRQLVAGLPKDQPIVLNVFGSTPLQLKIDASFLSGDVDVFSHEDFSREVAALKLGPGQSNPCIEWSPPNVFIASPVWRERADRVMFENITVYIASPLDVLVGKVKRLEPKDLDAFDLVKTKTGGPSETVLRDALREVVDMYRPNFDEENSGGDAMANTKHLWRHLFGREIDVRSEIIAPALEARRAAQGGSAPEARQRLKEIAED